MKSTKPSSLPPVEYRPQDVVRVEDTTTQESVVPEAIDLLLKMRTAFPNEKITISFGYIVKPVFRAEMEPSSNSAQDGTDTIPRLQGGHHA